ncbi:GNAT family N-acetyltransferase [soil metagenome]
MILHYYFADVFTQKTSVFFVMKQSETERLVLKFYSEENKNDFLNLFTDAEVMKFVDKGVMTNEQAEAFWRKLFEKLYPQNFLIWAVFDKSDSRYVGHAGIYPRPTKKEDWEFVYFLCRNEWGKGCATEIARRLIKYAFEELNLNRVFATVDEAHSTSIQVLEKAGMKFEHYESDEQGRFSVYASRQSFTN